MSVVTYYLYEGRVCKDNVSDEGSLGFDVTMETYN